MNILIFEYITGGGLVGEALPSSLLSEGELMLNAVAKDFSELTDVQVSVMRDYRLQRNSYVEDEYVVTTECSYTQVIDKVAKSIYALLIIAPESENILSILCEKYSDREFILLNSTSKSAGLMGNKFNTYKYLQSYDIAQIPTYEVTDIKAITADKIVIKPNDGVGCGNIQLLTASANTNLALDQFDTKDYIAQPYLQGQSASLCLLCWNGECIVLSANTQNIEEIEDSLELKSCIVNTLDRQRFVGFCKNLIKALPGLRGYVGVDILIIEDVVLLVEVNPRLTTSYVGLKSALGVNPAELILQTFVKQKLPEFVESLVNSVTVEIGAERAA